MSNRRNGSNDVNSGVVRLELTKIVHATPECMWLARNEHGIFFA